MAVDLRLYTTPPLMATAFFVHFAFEMRTCRGRSSPPPRVPFLGDEHVDIGGVHKVLAFRLFV